MLRAVYRFICDLVIGDDWKIVLAALLSLAAGLAVIGTGVFIGIAVPLTAVVIVVAFGIALMVDVRRQ